MSIILSSIKRSLRDKGNLMGCIFLVIILPYIFSTMFNVEESKEDIYINIIGNEDSQIMKSYISILEGFDDANDNVKIDYEVNKEEYTKEQDNSSSDESILLVKIDEENRKIELEGESKLSIGQEIVKEITEKFSVSISDSEALMTEGYAQNDNKDMIKIETNPNYVKEDSWFDDVDSKEYYSVVMLQMLILSLSTVAFRNTFYIKGKIGNRVKSSSIKTSKFITLEVIGSFISIFLQGIITLGLIYALYGVNINSSNILRLILLIGMLSILSVSIGILSTSIANKKSTGDNMCTYITVILAMSSGTLMPQFSDMSAMIDNSFLLSLNPFYLIGNEFILLTMSNTTENIMHAIIISLITSMLFVITSILILKRRVVK